MAILMRVLALKKFVAFVFILLPCLLGAQTSGFNFAFQSGPSFPMGNFKKAEFENGSFALSGVNFSFESEYRAFEKFGLGLKASVNFHPVNVSALINAELERDPFLLDLNIRSEAYRSIQLLLGAIFHSEIKDNLRWNSKMFIGICQAQSPYKLYEAEYFLLGKNTYRITSAKDVKASGLISTGIEYLLKPYFSVHSSTEFTYTPVEFGFATAQGRRIEKHDLMFLNILAGFRVYL